MHKQLQRLKLARTCIFFAASFFSIAYHCRDDMRVTSDDAHSNVRFEIHREPRESHLRSRQSNVRQTELCLVKRRSQCGYFLMTNTLPPVMSLTFPYCSRSSALQMQSRSTALNTQMILYVYDHIS